METVIFIKALFVLFWLFPLAIYYINRPVFQIPNKSSQRRLCTIDSLQNLAKSQEIRTSELSKEVSNLREILTRETKKSKECEEEKATLVNKLKELKESTCEST